MKRATRIVAIVSASIIAALSLLVAVSRIMFLPYVYRENKGDENE